MENPPAASEDRTAQRFPVLRDLRIRFRHACKMPGGRRLIAAHIFRNADGGNGVDRVVNFE